jgi:hypothetical protein
MATAEEISAKICSKCEKDPASKGDAWCKECRGKYQKEYRESLEWRAERRGIIRGIQGMREHVAAHFRQWGGRPFMGSEVGNVVDALPGPAVADESAKPQ